MHYHQHYQLTNKTFPGTQTGIQYPSPFKTQNKNGNDDEDLKNVKFGINDSIRTNDYYLESRLKPWNEVHLASSVTFVRR